MSDIETGASEPVLLGAAGSRYCLRCQALLPLSDWPACPRCGLMFDPANPATYGTAARFQPLKFWFPGFFLAVACGVVTYAIVLLSGQMGFALFIGVPVSFAAILGYATRVRVWAVLMLSILAVACVVMAIVSMSLAGIFCGMTLSLIFLVPALFGALLGWVLRAVLKAGDWDQRHYFPVLLLALLPLGVEAVENLLPPPTEIATVETSLTFHATPREAWNSIMFYEQVEHAPPLLLRLALPRPIRAEGSMAKVGDVQRCIYQKGHIIKEISRRDESRLLEFKVTEQYVHFERDVTLLDGSFTLAPIDDNETRVTLKTRYVRHLSPAWLWEPMERKVVHTLHEHVLEGMRRRACEPDRRAEIRGEPSSPVAEATRIVQARSSFDPPPVRWTEEARP